MPFLNNTELHPGDVVEFCGAEGTGKSELLLKVAATCVLPKSWCGVMLPGRNVDALFISNDCDLDLVRLAAVMEDIVLSHGVMSIARVNCKELISTSLERLHVVCCKSMDELIVTLHSLRTFLKNRPEVCALLIDNVAAFWWSEVATSSTSDSMHQRWTGALSELIREFHLVVIAARPLLTKDMAASHDNKVSNDVDKQNW